MSYIARELERKFPKNESCLQSNPCNWSPTGRQDYYVKASGAAVCRVQLVWTRNRKEIDLIIGNCLGSSLYLLPRFC